MLVKTTLKFRILEKPQVCRDLRLMLCRGQSVKHCRKLHGKYWFQSFFSYMSSKESSFCGDCSCSAVSSSIGAGVMLEMLLVVDLPGCSITIYFSLCILMFCLQQILQIFNQQLFTPVWKVSSTDLFMTMVCCLTFVGIAFLKTIYPKYQRWLHSHPTYQSLKDNG